MPEGHMIHRLAADYREYFADRPVRASSPQGKFADGAALVDGQPLTAADAHGKHLFLGFAAAGWVHIHLGLFGKLTFGPAPAPPPTDTVRLRLANADAYAYLRGPTTCALITDAEKQAIHERLGPDPLRARGPADRPVAADPSGDGEVAWRRISRSRSTVAALLMDQKVVAGVGNVYRAEVLFRHGIDPYRAGRDLTWSQWDAVWADLVYLMREGVRNNRIDTVRPEHLPEAMGRPPRVDDHGGRGVRVPQGQAVLPHLWRRDPHRRTRRPQPLLVPGGPAPLAPAVPAAPPPAPRRAPPPRGCAAPWTRW